MAKKRKIDGVIAEGEVTGHAHRVHGADVYQDEETKTIEVAPAPGGTRVIIVHEEHGLIVVPKETAKVGADISIVKEYDPFAAEAERVRRVMD